ncbi:MAG TPA: hydrolase TatD [Desulfobulbaceae bacterium]|nr:hydrolase TatD [Desulfobulbaceae bacterium]
MSNKHAEPPPLPLDCPLIDSHCHLDMDAYAGDLASVVRSAAACGVCGIITVGIDLDSSKQAAAIARLFPGVWATAGIHPHNAADASPAHFAELSGLAADKANKVVAYGEIGLDYARNYDPAEVQQKVFSDQLGLARELGLPVVIHDRDAHEDTIRLLRENGPFPAGGVMHCFSGDSELARQVIDLGLHVSIPGIVTFGKSEVLQQVARDIPLTRMLLETDGPFLAPVPFRGKTNRPEYLVYTAQKIAALRGIPFSEVARQTSLNASVLFRLDLEPALP